MGRSHKVAFSTVIVTAGAVGAGTSVAFLSDQGLDRAEKWVSIGGVVLSVLIAAVGLRVSWLTWRRTGTLPADPTPVRAGGAGAVAVGGRSSGEIVTDVSGAVPATASPPAADGVDASGRGSVAVGGDNAATIRTTVSDVRETP